MNLKVSDVDMWVVIVTALGILMGLGTIVFLRNSLFYQTSLILSLLITALPFTLMQYLDFKRVRDIEQFLPDFLRDVAESNRSGMPLAKAIESATKGSYGPVTKEMKMVSDQISWGVPFEDTLLRFGQRVKSKIINQAVLIIIQSHRSGGEIADILETVSTDIRNLKRVESERKSKLKVYLVSVYFIFFLFLGIIVALTTTFVPATPELNQAAGMMGGAPSTMSEEDFKQYFFHLCLIQAFFAGLIGGQMGEGSPISGIKHSVILVLITLFVFQFFLPSPKLGERIPDSIMKISPNAVNFETSKVVFTAYSGTTSEEIAKQVRALAAAGKKEAGYMDILAEDITFSYGSCAACERGDISISKSEIIVNKPTKVTYTIMGLGNSKYNIAVSGAG